MTKSRAPLTFEDAVTRVAARVGWDAAGAAAGVGERQARNWSDPDHAAQPSLLQALALDLAYRRDGGGEAPLLAAYAQQLEATLTCPPDAERLAADTSRAASATGEALAAAVMAVRPGATSTDRAIATRELQAAGEAITTLQRELGAPEHIVGIPVRVDPTLPPGVAVLVRPPDG